MNRRGLVLALILVFILVPVAQADTVYVPMVRAPSPVVEVADVRRVIDGDTVDVRLLCCPCIPVFRVRLLAIDTPERGECYYGEATEALASVVGGRRVGLERDRSEFDVYGRLLRHLHVGGLWVNGDLVARGYARVRIVGDDDRYAGALYVLEDRARSRGLGGWSACAW